MSANHFINEIKCIIPELYAERRYHKTKLNLVKELFHPDRYDPYLIPDARKPLIVHIMLSPWQIIELVCWLIWLIDFDFVCQSDGQSVCYHQVAWLSSVKIACNFMKINLSTVFLGLLGATWMHSNSCDDFLNSCVDINIMFISPFLQATRFTY